MSGRRLSNTGKVAIILLVWLATLAIVIWGELIPGYSAPMEWISETHVSDKLLHFVAYLGLAFLPVAGFRFVAGISCALLMIPLGVALEFLQELVPGRTFDLRDMLANTAGVLTGLACAMLLRKLRQEETKGAGPVAGQ